MGEGEPSTKKELCYFNETDLLFNKRCTDLLSFMMKQRNYKFSKFKTVGQISDA